MEKQTVAEFITANKAIVSVLVKAKQIPLTVVRAHQVYESFASKQTGSKMDKYQAVAEETKTSVTTVRNAVRDMQKPI